MGETSAIARERDTLATDRDGSAAVHGGAASGIGLHDVTKVFAGVAALDGVSLQIEAGEFFVVLGPSGCGKSTLVRLIAGLEAADRGSITLAGREVAAPGRHLPPEARDIAMVFQSYALWPHMSVRKNVAFPVEASGNSRQETDRIVDEALEAVSLGPLAERRPAALSGGQQQRVALARCLASHASTVLMDEPLANLDVHLRAAMEDEIARVHAASGATTVYITHDQREAMSLATRVAVMDQGRVLQTDPPQTLYEQPLSETVARFIGRAAILAARVESAQGTRALVRIGEARVEVSCPEGTVPGQGRLVVRPQDISLADDQGSFAGIVRRASYRGGQFELTIEAPGFPAIEATSTQRLNGAVSFAITGGWVLPQSAASNT